MTDLLAIIAQVPGVEAVRPWQDRHYINLAAARGSRANADLRTKLWVKGSVLTIEFGKGYFSDAWKAQKASLVAAVTAAGGTVREV